MRDVEPLPDAVPETTVASLPASSQTSNPAPTKFRFVLCVSATPSSYIVCPLPELPVSIYCGWSLSNNPVNAP